MFADRDVWVSGVWTVEHHHLHTQPNDGHRGPGCAGALETEPAVTQTAIVDRWCHFTHTLEHHSMTAVESHLTEI
jgi:hypothetical protein